MSAIHLTMRQVGRISQEFGSPIAAAFGVEVTEVVECGRCFALLGKERIEAHVLWHGDALEHWNGQKPTEVTWEIVGPLDSDRKDDT